MIPNLFGVEIDIDKELLACACCDCGLVHDVAFAIEDNGKLGIAMRRNKRATAQLRRHNYGNLQQVEVGGFRIIRRGICP